MIKSNSYQSPLLEKITWRDVTISFNYDYDRTDVRVRQGEHKERLTNIVIKHENTVIKQITLDNNHYFGDTSNNYRLKLESIKFMGNLQQQEEVYSFGYNGSTTQLPHNTVSSDYSCHEDYWGYWNGTSSQHSERFPTAIANVTRLGTDTKWKVDNTNRNPDENFTKACVLNKIIYPTKGRTEFEYELNSVSYAYQYGIANNGKVGGLRLKKRINYSDETTISDIKEYEYSGYATMLIEVNMFTYTIRYYHIYLNKCGATYGKQLAEYPVKHYISSSQTPLTGNSNSPVFYNLVREYNGYKYQNLLGWTEYRYKDATYNSAINGYRCPPDAPIPYACVESTDFDNGLSKGLLTSRTEFNSAGDTVKKYANNYYYYSLNSFHTGVKLTQSWEYPQTYDSFIPINYVISPSSVRFQAVLDYCQLESRPWVYQQYYLDKIFAHSTFGYQNYYILSGSTETEYENGQPTLTKTITYGYDMKDCKHVTFTPSLITQKNSKNEVYTKRTIFPYHDNYKNISPYNTMINKNMLDYPVEEKIEKNGSDFISHTRTSYEQAPYGNLILPKTLSAKYTTNGSFEPRISYNKYDSRGNSLYLSKDDAAKVVYLWGYNYKYPIAEIKNATYEDVRTALNYTNDNQIETLAAKAEPSASDWTLINNLRTKLPNAQITVNTYKPLVGISTSTNPDGTVVYYEYDELNRLKNIKDHKGNILQQYDYKYYNQ
ncbi:MAG: hypothetical protein LBQ28_05325 [Prevotellaceae bacterium]|jgi:YD repeat-containing protein|nr:hypothetical protein [Prevotellaceae bacterium]